MPVWRFSLIIEGRDLDDDEILDALFAAGCDDALFGGSNGVQCADFHREAEHLEDAVLSAVAAVESIDRVEVVGLVEQDLVSLAQIAERTGQALYLVRECVQRRRGQDRFPDPVDDPRRSDSVWRWRDVADWFAGSEEPQSPDPDQRIFATLVRAVEMRQALRATSAERRASIGEFITAG